MKIKNIRINGFGKLNNIDIDLDPEINVIKGNNESGKSTIVKFIQCSFYGASKNKNGKAVSDYDKYLPWKGDSYSGRITYELDNEKEYIVYRDFKKKNPIIYNSLKEDISSTFPIDRTKGIDFMNEQTNIDEDAFINTAVVEQESVKLDRNSQGIIVQKISNMLSSGDDSISYKTTMNKINKKQNDEVGTDKTSQKPINIIQNRIEELSKKKKGLEEKKSKSNELIYSLNESKCMLEAENKKIEFLGEVKNKLDNNRIKNAEISFSKNLEEDYSRRISNLNSIIKNSEQKSCKNFVLLYIILLVIIAAVFAILMFKKIDIKICISLIVPFVLILIKMIYDIASKKSQKGLDLEKLKNELEILNENLEDQQEETIEKIHKLKADNENTNKILFQKYNDDVDSIYLEEFIGKEYSDIQKEIEKVQKSINLLRVNVNATENEITIITQNLDELSKIEEDLEVAINDKYELEKLNNAYSIAKECMERAYESVKQNISPNFTNNLCAIISEISNGKYKKVLLNDTDGLEVETDSGKYIPVSDLSTGTVDQMYLSLRLSALEEISSENLPIILDETFAFFDDERLDNILRFLSRNYKNQIIILTCSDREIQRLKRLNIEYNLISLEK